MTDANSVDIVTEYRARNEIRLPYGLIISKIENAISARRKRGNMSLIYF